MKTVLPLFVFIDACGWEIVKNDPFLNGLAPTRKRLDSVLGYSSACVPSILSGRYPAEHRNWSYLVYDPKRSPFKFLKPLGLLPEFVTSRRIVRRSLSRFLKRRLGFKGYFDIYNLPLRTAGKYDFTEKRSPLKPGGMNRGTNIFDFLQENEIPYHVSNPERTEEDNLNALINDIKSETIDFAFLYWPGLDGFLHMAGNTSREIPQRLRQYESCIEQLTAAAGDHYSDVRLYVFSDHGMANCDEVLDLKNIIDALPLKQYHDYAVVYDSTMARFWFFSETARKLISDALQNVPQGRILPDAELDELGALFPDRYFGEMFFLVKEGVLIVPSHMGARPIRAMHGYHPSEKHSYALLCTNQVTIPDEVSAIPDMYKLMVRDAELAHAANAMHGVSMAAHAVG
jgi:hypothetical protein